MHCVMVANNSNVIVVYNNSSSILMVVIVKCKKGNWENGGNSLSCDSNNHSDSWDNNNSDSRDCGVVTMVVKVV